MIICPKSIIEPPRKEMRLERGSFRNNFGLESISDKIKFSAFMRKNESFPENFSIGLTVYPNDESGSFCLLRYNGPHGDHVNNLLDSDPHFGFHIHQATAENIEKGFSNKERIFNKILSENHLYEENGNLYIDTKPESLYSAVLQFAQTVAKISNMRLYKREVVENLFYEILEEIVKEKLNRFHPKLHVFPLPEREDLEVDYAFDIKPCPVYLFGVKGTAKARLTTISCQAFQIFNLKFKGFAVHEDFDILSKKDRNRITSATDKQFVSLDDFRNNAVQVFEREAA